MLGCARGGWAVSRALGGLYGGRVSCHGSIMYGTRSRVPQRDKYRQGACTSFRLAGCVCVSFPSVGHFGGSVCPSYVVVWNVQ